MKWILILIALLIIARFTPLQNFNPLATPRDCKSVFYYKNRTQPGIVYDASFIRTALFGERCVSN
jgi:hypothetical protein